MCGIVGFATIKKNLEQKRIINLVGDLLKISEVRGKEAAGVAILTDKKAAVYKRAMPATKMIKTKEYNDFFSNNINNNDFIGVIGHSRLVTNGSEQNCDNNQPVSGERMICVHNGIIVNVDELWEQNVGLKKKSELDSEIIVTLTEHQLKQQNNITFTDSLTSTYKKISGMASTLSIDCYTNTLTAATNNGSLYFIKSDDEKSYAFASEYYFLKELLQRDKLAKEIFDDNNIKQLQVGSFLNINLADMKTVLQGKEINLNKKDIVVNVKDTIVSKVIDINLNKCKDFDIDVESIRKLKRCTKCVLPETMPFIEFDEQGVCNYCRTYKKQEYKGITQLNEWAEDTKRRNNNGADSIVSFSGGRDSSYGLHYFVKELGLNPICYSYDWGMVTDLARRNQSRMCSQLGVELIIVSADLKKKRRNIASNVNAWLKNPDLGMIPIFMAGDKQYFYYANQIRKTYGLEQVLMASNPFEKTHFKAGFCGSRPGVLEKEESSEVENLPLFGIFNMSLHYAKQYLLNPAYINASLIDTAFATVCYYAIPHNYFRLFNYVPWEEDGVNNVLINEYDWEISPDSESTWRIGDGTAPFYNYIYYKVAGFTENDTLRSNQIREGYLTREKALKLVERDNSPRFESMKWYFETINVDMYEALKRIDKIKKLYEQNN